MAGSANITFTKGDNVTIPFFFQDAAGDPINITGRTYASQIRKVASSTGAPNAQFTATIVDGAGGELELTLSNTDSDALTAGTYFWDLEDQTGGNIQTILSGKCIVKQDVTK